MTTTTLHIEHAITDYPTWKAAFDGFADARHRGGVRDHRIRVDEDDDRYIVVDLDFDSPEQARAFAEFLRDQVWGGGRSPALVGAPSARVLVTAGG